MGDNVFGFTGLTSINIPSKITEIPNLAFTNSKLTSIVLSDNVTKIGDNAFFNCLALNSVKLSANLLSIGNNAFSGRPKNAFEPETITTLKGIVVPRSVTSIGSSAFFNSPAYVFVEANSQLDSTSLGNIQRPILVGNETDLLALQKKQPSIEASSGMVLNSMYIEGLPNGEVTICSEYHLKAVAENTISPDGELKGSQNVKWSTTADPKVAEIDENTGFLKINGTGDLDFYITAVSKYGLNIVFGSNSGDFVDNSNGKLTSVGKSIKITSKEKAPDPVDPTPDPVDPNPITPIVPKPAPVEPVSKPDDKNDSKTPDTGDTSNQLIWTSLLLGTIVSCVFLAKKRKKTNVEISDYEQ